MIPMTWRQHRLQLAAAGALLAALAGYFLIGAVQRADYAEHLGLTGCMASAGHQHCGPLAEAFFHRFGGIPGTFTLLTAVPLLAGLFWGAPLIAREVETGTHRLAWTQSVPRRRWLAVKLAAFLTATVLAAAALSLSFSSWISDIDRMSQAGYTNVNRLNPVAFDLTGLAPIGTALFAFALGAAAGALIGRTVPAMAVTLGGYLAVTIPLQSLRYQFFAPRVVSGSFATTSPVEPGGYTMSSGYADAAGHPVDFDTLIRACGTNRGGNGETLTLQCLAGKGFRITEVYQPGSRYWPLQYVDFTIYAVAAIALLAGAMWWTTRRIS